MSATGCRHYFSTAPFVPALTYTPAFTWTPAIVAGFHTTAPAFYLPVHLPPSPYSTVFAPAWLVPALHHTAPAPYLPPPPTFAFLLPSCVRSCLHRMHLHLRSCLRSFLVSWFAAFHFCLRSPAVTARRRAFCALLVLRNSAFCYYYHTLPDATPHATWFAYTAAAFAPLLTHTTICLPTTTFLWRRGWGTHLNQIREEGAKEGWGKHGQWPGRAGSSMREKKENNENQSVNLSSISSPPLSPLYLSPLNARWQLCL